MAGVGPGLGEATAYMLLRGGAQVIISARKEDKLIEMCAALSKYGKVDYAVGDASTLAGAQKMMSQTISKIKKIDDIVLTLGNYAPTDIAEVTEEQMEAMLGVNLKSPVYLIRSAIPFLREGSSIVMVSSLLGLAEHPSGEIAYAAAKAGVAKATEVAASALLGRGIRVNAVAPKSMRHDFEPERRWREQRRLGDVECPPEDVASVIAFLLSKDSEWIDGCVIPVDGGSRLKKG